MAARRSYAEMEDALEEARQAQASAIGREQSWMARATLAALRERETVIDELTRLGHLDAAVAIRDWAETRQSIWSSTKSAQPMLPKSEFAINKFGELVTRTSPG